MATKLERSFNKRNIKASYRIAKMWHDKDPSTVKDHIRTYCRTSPSVSATYSLTDNQINTVKYCSLNASPCLLLCRLPALAKATYRDHFCRRASSSSSASQKMSVTFFTGTTQASYLIFGTEHQCGELYPVTHF